jgi:cadmium resistance protein CadD (predicted permease)
MFCNFVVNIVWRSWLVSIWFPLFLTSAYSSILLNHIVFLLDVSSWVLVAHASDFSHSGGRD